MGILQPALTTLSSVIFSGPAHLLCFSALLGGQLYQTFVLTTIAFRALPRQPFTTLQAKLFPAYFRLQTAALLLTVLTWPPYSVLSLADAKSHWIPLAVAMGAAVQNLLLFGPRTGRAMIDLAQMGRERKPDDTERSGQQMAAMKRTFSKNHAASIHLNLIVLGATLWHGWLLAFKFQF